MAAIVALIGVLGLLVGSFLNVVAYREPRGESLLWPGSHCPNCQHPIRPWHNVPVLSWLVLRGRCADCRAPISVRYPLVELVTGVLFALLAWRLWATGQLAALPVCLYLAAAGMALALIDLDVRRLPNSIVLPSYPVVAVLLVVAALVSQDWTALLRALIGGVALFAFFLLLALIYPAGMGWGDVKLSGILGAVLGYFSVGTLVLGIFAAFAFGAVVGLGVMAAGRGNRKTALPFGPFLIAGTLVGIFAGSGLTDLYVHAIGG